MQVKDALDFTVALMKLGSIIKVRQKLPRKSNCCKEMGKRVYRSMEEKEAK